MRKVIPETTCLFLLFIFSTACSPLHRYSTANAHSHNDYLNKQPFVNAYNEKFGSIEADVFPVNGVLCVAHSKKEIKPSNTLRALYLDPLLDRLLADSKRKLNLLIDIKEDYKASLKLLQQELQPLMPYLSTPSHLGNITISISGARPTPAEYKEYPEYIFFDDDLKLKHNQEEWKRVNLVSLPFNKISLWKGDGAIPKQDLKKLKHKIDSVHAAGKPIRFWAAPDALNSWKEQARLKADLIGTDKINELATYLRKGRKNF
jgi:alkaline phosphatase